MSAPQVVLITGANQGLGYLAALQLSKIPGYHILLGARDAVKGANAVKQIEAEGASSAGRSRVFLIEHVQAGPRQ
jgi:NAD(P)-dependent dehydrogenase (short-subunit alcohol dehydrogenase family)